MKKKVIIAALTGLLILLGLYLKFYYPGSQFQLKQLFKFVEAMPAEHFYNSPEKSCGVWYERSARNGESAYGNKNGKVESCFKKAFKNCVSKNVFLVKDASEPDEQILSYSLIRILKKNDQDECIIQNFHEEQRISPSQEAVPLSYVNTCTILKDDLWNSCEPLYVRDWRKEISR